MEVYCTMLLTDGYLPGAQVLAHSLRDGGATRKLAILITQDFLSEATMKELKRIYDYIIPVDRITNKTHGNLLMMDRLDLSSAFTKIHLWRMTQFEKIVYIDADVVALRAPEELFETKERFSAAPDIGWPDCFNSGVMVLKPDTGTYHGLLNLANRGISFDGADQGLLNEYFRNWNRLSFVYNVTPSGHYQYAPAYNHYRSSITMAHFIGSNKPWAIGRYAGQESPTSAYGELLGRWWSIWDAHYRPVTEQDPALTWLSKGLGERLTIDEIERPNPMPTEYDPDFRREHTSFDERKDEPVVWHPPPVVGTKQEGRNKHQYQPQSYQPQQYQPPQHYQPPPPPQQQQQQQQQHYNHHGESPPPPVFLPKEHVPYVPRDLPYNAYSQTQAPPPSYSYHERKQQHQHQPQIHAPRPVHPQWEEGRRFSEEIPARIENSLPLPPLPSTAEEQSQDSEPKEKKSPSFEAPMQQWDAGRFPPPPNSRPEASNWPSHVYANEWDQAKQDTGLFVPPRVASPPTDLLNFEVPPKPQPSPRPSPIFPWEHGDVTPATRVFAGEESPSPTLPLALPGSVDDEFETEEAAGGYSARGMAGWDSYSRTNAWDSIPSIERYVASFQKTTQPRRTVRKGDVTPNPQIRGADETIRTDGEHDDETTRTTTTTTSTTTGLLPPEISVTPTPFKSLRGYRSHAMDDEAKFPSAQGIPDQQHWDPMKSLAELRNAPGELLNRSPPSPQSLARGSPRSPVPSAQQLVSSSMPVPEKDFHITAHRKRHEMSVSSGNSSVTGSPVNTFSERAYASSSTQTKAVASSDAGTQSDPEDIDAEMVMVGVH